MRAGVQRGTHRFRREIRFCCIGVEKGGGIVRHLLCTSGIALHALDLVRNLRRVNHLQRRAVLFRQCVQVEPVIHQQMAVTPGQKVR
jgi:hypothetical protein